MSDCQYIGKCFPGPGTYRLDHKWTEEKARTSTFAPDKKENKGWKPVKSKAPDVGTYDQVSSKDKTLKRPVSHYFVRPGTTRGDTEKVTFTTEYTRMKKFVPGTGSYNVNLNVVSRPYTRKRC